jgi:hypothetical protein
MVRDAPIGKAEAARNAAGAVPARTSGFPRTGVRLYRLPSFPRLQPMDEIAGQNRSITPI